MSTVDIPIDELALPFLDRQGVKYEVIQREEKLLYCIWIRLEITQSNLVDYGWARQKYGQHLGLKANLNSLNIKP